ncbi:hypothetical protein D3C77_203900 [compost metagenome]|uniref:hypothetical protein n=1 Tax=Pseudomonas TaxID=286 RepID=UPI00041034B3|nr:MULTISPECIES: hypothetical protein [Pseudomonas]MCW2270736.1 Fe2+ or Zn2+ uptake regulation protein [Pseudomonas sp. JUb96]
MSDITLLKALIVQRAMGGIGAAELRQQVMQQSPQLTEAALQSVLVGLQEEDRLCGHEVEGQWMYTAIDKNDPGYTPLEYSPQFAEQIIAASCEAFHEIDVDDMISQLDAMIAKARARQNNG